MKYMGSKNRLSKELAPIIQSYVDKGCNGYLEPFVGGANMIDKIKCNKRCGCDNHKYLIALLKQISLQWIPPKEISEELYNDVRLNKDKYDDFLVGFIGFCCSFGSKFFGGYARGKKSSGITSRNYAEESYRNLIKQAPNLKDIIFECRSFETINPNISNFVIYCDPPYRGTTKYKTEDFPYEEFYDWCRKMSKNNIVLISEYNMPSDFECIWSKETLANFDSNRKVNDDKNKRVEKLFIYKGGNLK